MRRRKHSIAQPSDIAFLLIIFFLLLSGIEVSKSLDLKTGMAQSTETKPFSLTVEKDGTLHNAGQQIDLQQLDRELEDRSWLSVSVDPDVGWQTVVDILSVAERRQVPANLEMMP
jgi:biopolymer transport protein ExbD